MQGSRRSSSAYARACPRAARRGRAGSAASPGAPASYAARTWPRISPSPGTSESSPAATRKRCSAAAWSSSRYAERRDLVAAERAQRLERALLGVVADGVELGAVARRETDALAAVRRELARERRRLARVERDALAHLDRRVTMRDADEREPHAKWVAGSASRTTMTSANAPSARYAVRRPRQP